MTKLERAITFLVMREFCTQPEGEEVKKFAQLGAKYIINIVLAECEHLEIDVERGELQECFPNSARFIAEVALLEIYEFIEARHAKQLIQLHFREPCLHWDVTHALIHSKLLDEQSGDELLTTVHEAMAAMPNAVTDIRNGKDKAIGALLGYVMKKVKANPNEVRELLLREIKK